jgi:hypothetical protein
MEIILEWEATFINISVQYNCMNSVQNTLCTRAYETSGFSPAVVFVSKWKLSSSSRI